MSSGTLTRMRSLATPEVLSVRVSGTYEERSTLFHAIERSS